MQKVTRTVLALELYAIVHKLDIKAVVKLITEKILNFKLLSIVVCTNSKLLYNCLVKLGNTQEKRLIVNLICLQYSYK